MRKESRENENSQKASLSTSFCHSAGKKVSASVVLVCTETMPKFLIKNEVFRPLRRHLPTLHLHRPTLFVNLLGLGLLSGSGGIGGRSGSILLGSVSLARSRGLGLGGGPEGLCFLYQQRNHLKQEEQQDVQGCHGEAA